ncbi:MAG: hypothetical protein LC131_02035, partial [Anaerolineae bacterium]|nr:hypothetical protein [Anaerolineae bacterium]
MPDVDEPATRRGLRPCMFCERAAVYEADDDDGSTLAVCDRLLAAIRAVADHNESQVLLFV